MDNQPAGVPDEAAAELARLRARVAALQAVQEVARDLTSELDLKLLLHKILRAAVTVMNCTAGSLLLYDPAASELVFEVVEGGGGEALERTRLKTDQGIAGAAWTRREAILVDDAAREGRYFSGVASSFGLSIKTLIAVPLIAKGNAIGVLELMNKASGAGFDADDRDLLLAFASQSAIAIENARLYRSAIEERDRILSVEASVRHNLARDLHDGPVQLISALIVSLRMLREVAKNAPERAGAEVLQLEALAQKAVYQIRNMLFDLRPVVLETQGLAPALQAYVERLRLVEAFRVTLDAGAITMRFEPRVEAAVFSIVQEAVNNAKKHAAPRNLWITAAQQDGKLVLRVRDDGRGFDVEQMEQAYPQRGSLGLLNMRERAEIARGRLEVDSQPGHGTTVTLRVPL